MQNDQDNQTPLNTQQKNRKKRKGDPIKIIEGQVTGDLYYSNNSPNLNLQNVQVKPILSDDSPFSYCQSSPVQSENGVKKRKISRRSDLEYKVKPEATVNLTPSDEDISASLRWLETIMDLDSPETDHKPKAYSETKSPNPIDFLIKMRIEKRAQESFFLYSEPLLELENPIKLTKKKQHNYHLRIDPGILFMDRERIPSYCYLIFLRFNNVREAFKTINQVRSNGLLQICKYRFPARLKDFQESEFGNEIILDGSFQILIFRVKIDRYRNLGVLNKFTSLFTAVFDKVHSEGTDVLGLVWEKYKRSKRFKEFSDVLDLYSAHDLTYSGILSEKKIVFDDKKNKKHLNAKFMTLDVNVEKIWPSGCTINIKRFCVNFLRQPINKRLNKSDFTRCSNNHLEVDVEFVKEERYDDITK